MRGPLTTTNGPSKPATLAVSHPGYAKVSPWGRLREGRGGASLLQSPP